MWGGRLSTARWSSDPASPAEPANASAGSPGAAAGDSLSGSIRQAVRWACLVRLCRTLGPWHACPMYIRRLVCRNVRGFAEIDLDFCPMYEGPSRIERRREIEALSLIDNLLEPGSDVDRSPFPGWTVITGDNGAGKSTILKSIALALLGPDNARWLVPNYDGWVTVGEPSGSISLEVLPDNAIDRTRAGGHPYKDTFWAEVAIRRDQDQPGGAPWVVSSADRFKNKKVGAEKGPWQLAPTGWLAIGYGPFRRMYGSSPQAAGLEADALKSRFTTLFLEDATLIGAEKWLQELDYAMVRSPYPEVKQRSSRQLAAIQKIISSDFLRNEMTFEGVDAGGVWLRDATNRRLRLSEMSEGYRAALAMLIDIIRHMFLCYDDAPDSVKESNDGYVTLGLPAVILIDEIDAHLHPAWQREIGPWLTGHFPLVQFIVTTHSPLVAQAATGGRVYVLPAPGSDDLPRRVTAAEYQQLLAGDTDAALASPAFGVKQSRSPRVVRAMQRHATLEQLSLFEMESTQQDATRLEYDQLTTLFDGTLLDQ